MLLGSLRVVTARRIAHADRRETEGVALSVLMCHVLFVYGNKVATMAVLRAETQMGAQGRLVIPAELRRALNLKPGDRLIARQEGDSLVLERREAIEQRLFARFAQIPKEVSLVDELIAERREAAQRECEE